MKRKVSSVLSISLIILLLAGLGFRQDIEDWVRLRGYTPTPEIVALADDTTMLDGSRRLFYVQRPLLADKATFNEHCRNNEQTIVLGCYIHDKGIFLLDVTDERLAGVEEVTAAHELLHAAYERLSGRERTRVDALVQSAYDDMNNDRLRETIELYRKSDPSVVPNELHSILGSEIRILPTELEAYYSQYFADRMAIVTFSERYEQAFMERRNAIRVYDEQLASLKIEIEGLQASLQQQEQALTAQRNEMNSLRSQGRTAEYNQQVPIYNQRVNGYNADIDRLESAVNRYNEIVQVRNEIASEEAELVEAIDSREVVPAQR